MADGFGFAGEGDWKTAALVRTMKVMALGLPGGTSFMEDYTYDFTGTPKVLGSHMLEICPSIAAGKPSLEVHHLGIGGKADPVRLVFTGFHRPCSRRISYRHGGSLPHHRQRGGRDPARAAASKSSRGTRRMGAQAESQDSCDSLDLCRRRPSHQLQPGADPRTP